MKIKILGTGCPKCKALEIATIEMVNELGIDAEVTKEEDIIKIMEYGVMRTPGLVIDGKVLFNGRIPSSEELKELLTK
jgi:small redox-active disulfide protein 2